MQGLPAGAGPFAACTEVCDAGGVIGQRSPLSNGSKAMSIWAALVGAGALLRNGSRFWTDA